MQYAIYSVVFFDAVRVEKCCLDTVSICEVAIRDRITSISGRELVSIIARSILYAGIIWSTIQVQVQVLVDTNRNMISQPKTENKQTDTNRNIPTSKRKTNKQTNKR
jgi:hypothetical protein